MAMREIKFRGYAYRDDEWRYGHYITDGVTHEINVLLPDNKTLYGSQINIESLGQYTGLKDKNGVEIYEGDIVNLHFEDEYSNDCVSVEGLTTQTARVKFDYQGVYGEEADSTWYYFVDLISNDVEIEVIGNIYENGELLEQ